MISMNPPNAMRVLSLLSICVLARAAQALTEEAAPLDDTAVLAALDDDDYFARQAQTRALLQDGSLTVGDIDRLYSQTQTLEQRHRLLRVARHHLIRRLLTERFGDLDGPGSMGLTHHVVQVTDPDVQTPRAGVMVVMTLPGFPAYEALEPGDVIIDFAGEPIPDDMTPTQFQNLIKAHQAGERIDLNVLRNGRQVLVPFTLSHNQALETVYDTGEVVLTEPYRGQWQAERRRLESLVGEAGTPPPAE